MALTSPGFPLFLAAVFFLYYFPLREKTGAQNILLLLASYVFYGMADWKMLPLLAGATAAFWGLGFAVGKTTAEKPRAASVLCVLGVCLGVGILLYFKYLNFFIGSFAALFRSFGFRVDGKVLGIAVPAGVSFFTFRLISYIIEIYRQKTEPERNAAVFAVYVAFFPAMMAGPIDRPGAFIPQIKTARPFREELAVDGCRQILWGAFKKIVIADSLARAVDQAWDAFPPLSGIYIFITVLIYAMQIYTDFSGYSDMAIGAGKLLGFRITANFKYPFYSRNIAEFWRGWHISLTSWLTDYVFMPLSVAFRNLGKAGLILAIMINMLLVGMWHEAKLTWVVFGLYNGILFIPLILSGTFVLKGKIKTNKYGLPPLKDLAGMILTYVLFALGAGLTRAESIGQAAEYYGRIWTDFLPHPFAFSEIPGKKAMLLVMAVLVFEWYGYRRNWEYAIAEAGAAFPRAVRWTAYLLLAFMTVLFFTATVPRQFIYFQF
jgi:D-alanyl-lipoteichoic acid acyltransferase DltB (MBOAT superfamily)